MGPSEGEKALSGGPEYGFRKILANWAGQKKFKTEIKLLNSWSFDKTKIFCGF